MGPGRHWFCPGAGEGFQRAERIGAGASDILVMTPVHQELRKREISLCWFLLQKSGIKGHLQQHRGIQKGFFGQTSLKKEQLRISMFLEKRILFTPCPNPPAAYGPVVHAGAADYWLLPVVLMGGWASSGGSAERCFLQQLRARGPEGVCPSCPGCPSGQAWGSSIRGPVQSTWSLEQGQRAHCDGH